MTENGWQHTGTCSSNFAAPYCDCHAEEFALRDALADPRISINHLPSCYYVKNLTGRPETCDCGRDAFRAEVAKLLGR